MNDSGKKTHWRDVIANSMRAIPIPEDSSQFDVLLRRLGEQKK